MKHKLHHIGEPTHEEKCHRCGRKLIIFDSAPKEVRFCGICVPLFVSFSRFCTRDSI